MDIYKSFQVNAGFIASFQHDIPALPSQSLWTYLYSFLLIQVILNI